MCGGIGKAPATSLLVEALKRLAYRGYDSAGVAVQLLAYYTALAKGTDIDQPRNLAKSVTVE